MDTNKLDVDAIFKQYSIKEIQAIEHQIKNEIEKKKEDLRIMVYNRYRDIIDAADGIHVMKDCSSQIEGVLKDLQSACEVVFSDKENPEFIKQSKQRVAEKTKRNNRYALAVIVKILQNSPSKIWYHLDNLDYLKAAKQYLIAQNAHICLEAEKHLRNQENSTIYIQYANELWNSIVFLSQTIASKAKATLNSSGKNVTSKVLVDAIAAIYLLESGSSLKNIFQDFIKNRTQIISSSLELDLTDSSLSIKDRIISCLNTYVCTIYQLHDLFLDDPDNQSDKYEDIITDSTFTIETLKDDGVVTSKIPVYLRSIKFKDTDNIRRFDSKFLVSFCSNWLASCHAELKAKIEQALKYANSLKSLSLIRDSVIQFESSLLAENKSASTTNNFSCFNPNLSWEKICKLLFDQKIEIWSQLVSSFYYSQAKSIIQNLFRSSHESLIKSVEDYLINFSNDQKPTMESDINAYLWSADITSILNLGSGGNSNSTLVNFFSTSQTSRLRFSGGKNSVTKQHTTPWIQNLCKQLDEDLNKLLSDIEYSTSSDGSTDLVVLNTDAKNFNEYLQESLLHFADQLGDSLLGIIERFKSSDEESSSSRILKILFTCRLAHALPYNCSSLKQCFMSSSQQAIMQQRQLAARMSQTDIMSPTSLTKKIMPNSEKIVNDENWLKHTSRLREIIRAGFNIWIESICSELDEKHLKRLSTSSVPDYPLKFDELIAWDEIDIDEELSSNPAEPDSESVTESIKTSSKTESFKSKLNVPSVASALIQTILYDLSQQLSKNLPYTMIDAHLLLKRLILSVFDRILKAYSGLIDQEEAEDRIKMTQNQALQALFDIKFLFGLFDLKSIHFVTSSATATPDDQIVNKMFERVVEEHKSLCSRLESLVDPFDFDICSPFIQSNINKAISRSLVLFSIITINDKHLKNAASASTTSSGEKFNLLVLSSNQQRFELLPLTTQQQQQPTASQSIQLSSKPHSAKLSDESSKKTGSSSRGAPQSGEISSSASGIFGFKWFN